eukprot:945431-Rhodomonas_salina.2
MGGDEDGQEGGGEEGRGGGRTSAGDVAQLVEVLFLGSLAALPHPRHPHPIPHAPRRRHERGLEGERADGRHAGREERGAGTGRARTLRGSCSAP